MRCFVLVAKLSRRAQSPQNRAMPFIYHPFYCKTELLIFAIFLDERSYKNLSHCPKQLSSTKLRPSWDPGERLSVWLIAAYLKSQSYPFLSHTEILSWPMEETISKKNSNLLKN